MKTIEKVEILRMKREAARLKMYEYGKSLATENEMNYWGKEMIRLDEEIKKIKIN